MQTLCKPYAPPTTPLKTERPTQETRVGLDPHIFFTPNRNLLDRSAPCLYHGGREDQFRAKGKYL
jgi:hypothetical protein